MKTQCCLVVVRTDKSKTFPDIYKRNAYIHKKKLADNQFVNYQKMNSSKVGFEYKG